MTTPSAFFIQGAALGLAAAATPGVFQAYLISQSIVYSFARGGLLAFAPMVSDPPIVIAIFS